MNGLTKEATVGIYLYKKLNWVSSLSNIIIRQGSRISNHFDHILFSSRDAIHTHFVTLIGKRMIVGGWVKHRADKRGKVARLKYKSYNFILHIVNRNHLYNRRLDMLLKFLIAGLLLTHLL